MPIKIYNTFRSRWCGAYLQSNGVKVIPTLAWGGPETFWFCFDGVEKKSVVAVSTLGVRSEKDLFIQGYNEMLRRINPEKIICYGKPFDEMKGDIVEVNYAKTNNLDKSCGVNGKYIKKTVGYVSPYREKGMGSAGGTSGNPKFPGWDPSKSPGEGYEWRGKGEPSSGKGAWYNPKTKETLHPDLDHPEPYGPHWDYNYPGKAIEYIRMVQLHQKTMKERYAMLEKNDWRLTNQEEYLKNAKLNFSRYKVLSPHWDHDHCAFCWEKFGENDESLKQGYCTPDKTYWICEECFNDFKDMFNFQVI